MEHLTHVLNIATDLFRHYGFKTITMDDIARRAGISKKTLYQHFANKQEVVNESVQWYYNQVFEQCTNIIATSENAIEAMVRIMQLVEEMCQQVNPLAMLELQRFFPQGYKIFREQIIAKDVEEMRKNIVQGIEEGYYRAEVNPLLMAMFHIETTLMLFQSSELSIGKYELHYVNHEVMEHFMYGIMTPKGIALYQQYKEAYLKQTI